MIVTDSLGAPRNTNEKLEFTKTWPFLINSWMVNNFNYDNFIFTQNGLDTDQLLNLTKEKLTLYDQEYLFVQVGIVDCARRVIGKRLGNIIFSTPGLGYVVRRVARKYHYRLTKLYKTCYVSKSRFKNNIDSFINQFSKTKIFIIPILPVGEAMKKKSFGIDEQINAYNRILREVASLHDNCFYLEDISTFFGENMDDRNYMKDGYHLSNKGHLHLFQKIKDEFNYKK